MVSRHGRRTHRPNTWQGRLVPAMRVLCSWSIHWHAEVLVTAHLTWELELIAVWNIHLALGHLEVLHLTLRQHTHVDILLVCSSQLVLLCLQQLDLLGESELFHCGEVHVSDSSLMISKYMSRGSELTHERCQLRRAATMSNVQSASSGTHRALAGGLTLLIHDVGGVVQKC